MNQMTKNQIYRALHMPPKRLLKKLTGQKEIYTIAVRPRAHQPGTEPLPALGGTPYTPLPYTKGVWYADPLLFHHAGKRWLFCEAFDMAANRGDIAVCDFDENGLLNQPQVILRENYHLSFPTVFDWNGEVWMIPESSANHSLNLYRCTAFPTSWELVRSFEVGCELCDTILLDKTPDALQLLCSETDPDNQLYVRYRRYYLRYWGEEYLLEEDEPFNLQHKAFDLVSRNAGPLFMQEQQVVHPTQISTTVDYGVYLQFLVRRGASEVPMCAATPQNVTITGVSTEDIIGIHTYCRDDEVEVIDLRYLRKIEKQPAAPVVPENPIEPEVVIAPAEELQAELLSEAERVQAEQALQEQQKQQENQPEEQEQPQEEAQPDEPETVAELTLSSLLLDMDADDEQLEALASALSLDGSDSAEETETRFAPLPEQPESKPEQPPQPAAEPEQPAAPTDTEPKPEGAEG